MNSINQYSTGFNERAKDKVLLPAHLHGSVFVALYNGYTLPTVFTNHLIVPTREQLDDFIQQFDAFYADHTDEEIAEINRKAEEDWEKEAYQDDDEPNSKPRKCWKKSGYVYLAKASTDPVTYKIGLTSNPEDRQRTFGVQLPFPIEFVHLIEASDMKSLEAELHERFSDKRVNGEFFALSDEDVQYIKSLRGCD